MAESTHVKEKVFSATMGEKFLKLLGRVPLRQLEVRKERKVQVGKGGKAKDVFEKPC